MAGGVVTRRPDGEAAHRVVCAPYTEGGLRSVALAATLAADVGASLTVALVWPWYARAWLPLPAIAELARPWYMCGPEALLDLCAVLDPTGVSWNMALLDGYREIRQLIRPRTELIVLDPTLTLFRLSPRRLRALAGSSGAAVCVLEPVRESTGLSRRTKRDFPAGVDDEPPRDF
jgi:hypothetical protein